jgi:hypothetical protein
VGPAIAEALVELVASAEPAIVEALVEPAELAEPAIAGARADRTASAAAICRAAGAGTGTPSEGETAVSVDRTHAPVAAVDPQAWDLAAAEARVVAAAEGVGKALKGIQER